MTVPPVAAIEGVVRDYAWGSTTSLQQLLGLPVDGNPAAELWLGAHPDSPSLVPTEETTLDALIGTDPAAALGTDAVTRFGPRLPFLLKVLAAEKPLSIQVHPNLAQAREGFAREEADGLPRTAPHRNYRDANHKPELLCALSPFEALCGFRPVAETLRLLDALDLPGLIPVAELLRRRDGLKLAFTALLRDADPQALAYAVADAAPSLPPEWDGPKRAVALAAAEFPGDVGVVLALLLNYVVLEPGEALYLGAGNVHAYLRGTGVEIMANSDNVLRCGLTPKHIDVDELLRITDFTELDDPRWPAQTRGALGRFVTPAPDFALAWIDADAEEQPLYRGVAQIVLCTSGTAEVRADGAVVALTPGTAAFVPASATAVVRSGDGGRVFVGSPALPTPGAADRRGF
ncbi:mannose-6-phosphate isomerase, class I [Jatrophihabitans sp.]|uniref:mannose-6-phosphate isomerase, class I n=1 Tax=Jatrophihabitans sp. TaxID=1932789 RepID=UPI0030C730F0|nr:Mannose-6-phosphate isomerase, type 1 [Jatrophihabitans sp.]